MTTTPQPTSMSRSTLAGQLVDPNGRPICGGELILSGQSQASIMTDTSGHYSATLAPGTYEVAYKGPGYLRAQRLGTARMKAGVTMDLGCAFRSAAR